MDPWCDRAPDYAAGILTPDERAAVEAHLRTCTACATELRSFAGVEVMLALAAFSEAPARDRRLRILAAISARP